MKVYLKQIKQKPITFSEDSLWEFTSKLSDANLIMLQNLIFGNESKIIPFSSFNDEFPSWVNNYIINAKIGDVIVLYQIELNYYVLNVVDNQSIQLLENGEWVDTNTSQYEQYSSLINNPDVLRLAFKTYLKCIGMGTGTWKSYPRYINLEDKNIENFYSIFTKSQLSETIQNRNNQLERLNQENGHHNYSAAINKYLEFFNKLSTGILDFSHYNDSSSQNSDDNNANQLEDNNQNCPLNIILYGAPGTGKTYHTVDYALGIIKHQSIDDIQRNIQENDNDKNKDDKRKNLMKEYLANEFRFDKENGKYAGYIAFTTFHQSYSYEDFIEGLKPIIDNNKELEFEWKPGIFKKIADEARNHKEHNYVIIIDEINRANMSRVLGELITLLETDKREGETNALSVILPSGNRFSVPNNLYVIGTMNTADKSISNIDVALRRRFTFIEQPVQPETIHDESRRDILKVINKLLKDYFKNTDLLIGQAYFMGKNKKLADILNNAVIPLLYEYYEDDRNEVKKIIDAVINEAKKNNISICEANDDYGRIKVEEGQTQAKREPTDNTVANKD